MDGCLSPIDGTGYTDGQHVDIAMFEYAEDIQCTWQWRTIFYLYKFLSMIALSHPLEK